MEVEFTRWDPVERLTSPDRMLAYLGAAFADGDPDLIAACVKDVARAKGLNADLLTAESDIGSLVRTIKALGLELAPKLAA
ncbi:MAG TPA: transcriptional regulator [Sphingomonas sp.]|jgi:hypothetical protein|nr:transcriptional regulator [Sphingomonas sp.]